MSVSENYQKYIFFLKYGACQQGFYNYKPIIAFRSRHHNITSYILIYVQETCSLIQAAVLRTASRLFRSGLHECFTEDYEHLFDVPQHFRTDNDVSGLAPIYIPAAG